MYLNYLSDKKHIKEKTNPKFDAFYDVCVVGLGTAGAIAAIAAAKKGVSVIGIEKLNSMGGTGTNGGVYDYFYGNDGGMFEEINRECFETVKHGYLSTDRFENKASIPGCVKSEILEQYAKENGCKIYYSTSVTGVFTQENKVVGIRIFKDGAFEDISAKIVMDCSGEAFLCRMCGCTMMPGRTYDNQLMKFSKPVGMIYGGYLVSVWQNCDFTDLNDAYTYSKKALESMCRPMELRDSYTNESRIMFESSHIGMRETYCVETEETFTFKEYIEGKEIKEPLFYGFAPLDNTNHDIVFESDEHKDWFIFASMCDYGFSVGVSKEMLIPKGYDGLMIAAKGIGIGHDMSGLLRMKKDMEKCGEAAAAVAAYAVKNNIEPRDVPYDAIIDELKRTGCFKKENNSGLCRVRAALDGTNPNPKLPESKEEIKKVLSSDNPGTGFWKVRISEKEKIIPELKKWLLQSDERLRKNAALCLGMIGDNSGIKVIHKILNSPPQMPEKIVSVRYYTDFARAIVVAGRLKDEKAVDKLSDIVESNAKGYTGNLQTGEYYGSKEAFEANFVSLAVEALLKISENSSRKSEITEKIQNWVNAENENQELERTRKIFKKILGKQ